ncbi:hypothetical protein GA0070558_11734 [Micromonospora haikouensis]|uniref:Nucleoid-associated protein GA0070558_11734 n=1 Tax=Micromonospora haikouensis TaxID=686309 RepID=A0A1C4WPG6_9ACTN|nr:YbaB/EbfC family nucleoid-associated protein [Micromonospora haikouensis]SCE98059.1 hypothetical protein GA0070558_11734 [Micromonospora haikouensis]
MQAEVRAVLDRAERLRQRMASAQEELGRTSVTGRAGGGLVTVTLSGLGELRQVHVDPAVFAEDDARRLEELFVAAVRDGAESVRRLASARMGPIEFMSVF